MHDFAMAMTSSTSASSYRYCKGATSGGHRCRITCVHRTRAAAQTVLRPDPAIVRLQVLLDRAGSSPGVIDGFYGDNVSKAVAGFEEMRGLPVDGRLDPDLAARLEDNAPIVERYVVLKEDATGLVDKIPEDYGEKAKMESLGYTSLAERLSERLHMDIDLVNTLNPGAKFAPGETVYVAMSTCTSRLAWQTIR
jgi:peptidoglycan hydrolase-like protein with peptidoglycan-binding domain